jgi:hypothetical protein
MELFANMAKDLIDAAGPRVLRRLWDAFALSDEQLGGRVTRRRASGWHRGTNCRMRADPPAGPGRSLSLGRVRGSEAGRRGC